MDGVAHIALASFFGNHSFIYRFDAGKGRYELSQRVESHAGHAWRHFAIAGETYLALANYRTGFPMDDPIYSWPKGSWFSPTVTRTNSTILRHNGSQFTEVQSIPTCGANAWTAFEVGGVMHLAVANAHNCTATAGHYDGTANSTVFAFSSSAGRFEAVQQLTTHAALDIEAFVIDDVTYLAVANAQLGAAFDVPSTVYRYSPEERKFIEHQQLATTAATGIEHFVLPGGTHFLAVANRYGPAGHRENSTLFRWQPSSDPRAGNYAFVPFQNLATKGAYDFEHFVVRNASFLAVANHWDEQARDPQHPIDINSIVYWWDGSQFEPFQPIPTTGAEQVRHIRLVVNGTTEHLLAIAQCVDGGTADPRALSQVLVWRG